VKINSDGGLVDKQFAGAWLAHGNIFDLQYLWPTVCADDNGFRHEVTFQIHFTEGY
jgi:hypothetical protein